MKFMEKLRVIERVDGLIRRKATGTADELAARLGVSRSTVFELFNCMKDMGAEIEYNETKKSYCYRVDKQLLIGYTRTDKLKGGRINKFLVQSEKIGLWQDNFVEQVFL